MSSTPNDKQPPPHPTAWYEEGSEVPPFKSGPPSSLGPPSNSGLHSPPFQPHYMWSPETFLMVRWMKGSFEFDQPQTNRKQNGSNRENFKQ